MKHGEALICRKSFAFKVNGKGRAITFKAGCRFWVTNTELNQTNRKAVNVARHNEKIGHDFTAEQVAEFFATPEEWIWSCEAERMANSCGSL